MLKVRTQDLENAKKQLEKSIEVLILVKMETNSLKLMKTIDKQIIQNRKQIILLKDEYYIN